MNSGAAAAAAAAADVASVSTAAAELVRDQPDEPQQEKERDGDGEESVKSEETMRKKKRSKKAYRQNAHQLISGAAEEQEAGPSTAPVLVHDGMVMVGPVNTRVRQATELFDAQQLTEVMRRGHMDTLFVNSIGCGFGDGPLMMGRIGCGKYCPPDRAYEIPEKFREQPKDEEEEEGEEEEGDKDGEEGHGGQEQEPEGHGDDGSDGNPGSSSVEIELD